MGVIWIQTATGQFIHLPIVGDDFNSPNDAAPIPSSVVRAGVGDRCFSGTPTVDLPGWGTVTFAFDPPGRIGSCNQCGQCCTHLISACGEGANCGYIVSGTYHICQYLTIRPKGIGRADGTLCSIRANIMDIFKGCILFPEKASEIVNCPACSFTFTE